MKEIEDNLLNTRVWLFNTKWLPKRFRFYVFLHIFHSGELPMHDHGARWLSIPLWGGYWEHTLEKGTRYKRKGQNGLISAPNGDSLLVRELLGK